MWNSLPLKIIDTKRAVGCFIIITFTKDQIFKIKAQTLFVFKLDRVRKDDGFQNITSCRYKSKQVCLWANGPPKTCLSK